MKSHSFPFREKKCQILVSQTASKRIQVQSGAVWFVCGNTSAHGNGTDSAEGTQPRGREEVTALAALSLRVPQGTNLTGCCYLCLRSIHSRRESKPGISTYTWRPRSDWRSHLHPIALIWRDCATYANPLLTEPRGTHTWTPAPVLTNPMTISVLNNKAVCLCM